MGTGVLIRECWYNTLSIGVMVLLIVCNALYGLVTVFPKAL